MCIKNCVAATRLSQISQLPVTQHVAPSTEDTAWAMQLVAIIDALDIALRGARSEEARVLFPMIETAVKAFTADRAAAAELTSLMAKLSAL